MFSCRVQHFAAGCSKTCLNHWLFTGSPHFSSIFGPVNPADYPPGAPRLQLLLVQPTALPKGDELYLGLARLPRSRTKVRNTYSMFIIYNIYLLYLYVFIYILLFMKVQEWGLQAQCWIKSCFGCINFWWPKAGHVHI